MAINYKYNPVKLYNKKDVYSIFNVLWKVTIFLIKLIVQVGIFYHISIQELRYSICFLKHFWSS